MSVSKFVTGARIGIMDEDEIAAWAKTAKTGDRIIYAQTEKSISLCQQVQLEGVAGCKDMAWRLARSGKVALFQRRNEDKGFDYIAVRGSFRPPRPKLRQEGKPGSSEAW